MTKKQYGRAAILVLILAGLKGMVQFQLPPIIEIFSDMLIVVGLACGIAYFRMPSEKNKNVNN